LDDVASNICQPLGSGGGDAVLAAPDPGALAIVPSRAYYSFHVMN